MTELSINSKIVLLDLPQDKEVLINFGIMSIRIGQLDSMLKMLLRDLADISKEEVLYATSRKSASELRKTILKIAQKRLGEGQSLLKLQALIERSNELIDRRNELIHSTWGKELYGQAVIRKSDHSWTPAPNAEDLNKLNEEIFNLTNEIRDARFGGFLEKALIKKNENLTI